MYALSCSRPCAVGQLVNTALCEVRVVHSGWGTIIFLSLGAVEQFSSWKRSLGRLKPPKNPLRGPNARSAPRARSASRAARASCKAGFHNIVVFRCTFSDPESHRRSNALSTMARSSDLSTGPPRMRGKRITVGFPPKMGSVFPQYQVS